MSKLVSTVHKLHQEYTKFQFIIFVSYRRLGYNTLEDMLSDIPDTVRVSRDCTGQIRLFGVANQDTEHIADMVKKQKKGSFNPYKPPPKV